MPKFRKKPVVIVAIKYDPLTMTVEERREILEWITEARAGVMIAAGEFRIQTLEGMMTVSPGDWVIRGIAGEVYPCKPDIFAATYEAVVE